MIFSISVCGQIIIVQQGGAAFQTVPLDQHLWIISVVIGLISIPIGAALRMIPDELVSLERSQKKRNTTTQQIEPVMYENNEKIINQINDDSIHWPIKIT